MKKVGIVLGVLVLLVAGYVFTTYNSLVSLDEEVNQRWAQIQNVYQRRADLIPNLVATVKGYASHESATLIEVTEARSKVTQISPQAIQGMVNNPQAMAQFQQVQDGLSSALSKLMVVVEKYPDLKANANFLQLQDQLEGTENRIAVERQNFNQGAQNFNLNIRQVPRNIIAAMFGFDRKAYFQATAGSESAPQVQF